VITATEDAVNKTAEILNEHPGMVFRVSILGGGCNGFQYHFSLTDTADDDIQIAEGMVTDTISVMYLDGAIIDYDDGVFAKTFTFTNPNVKSTCGCGESFGV
jgi:iron-sulfur cluster assembly accessory protein